MSRIKPGEPDNRANIQINCWIPRSLRDRFRELAVQQQRSMSSLLRVVVSDYVEANKEEEKI